ncbi:MAG: hypothetical protein LBT96_05385 [Campylobacteraceae bacterium]|jgi:hypothetical protein|nr:hypothetical protein [Campylobacteraceae bacterium]
MNKILEFIAKAGGFISKTINYFEKYIVIFLFIVISILVFHNQYLISELKKCETAYDTVKAVQDVKQEYVDRIITKEIVVYKDKIRYIQEAKIDENKTVCENALSLLRDSF